MVSRVYHVSISDSTRSPTIDFSLNRKYDWILIDTMLTGITPVNNTVLDNVDIYVRSKLNNCDVLLFGRYKMVSERVMNILAPIAKNDVDWYRLRVNEQPFYVLVIKRIIDCLDRENSRIEYYPSGKVMFVRKYVLKKETIPDVAFFCIPERPAALRVTPIVKDQIEANGVNCFDFYDIENPPSGALIP